jgi:hypothetical protein
VGIVTPAESFISQRTQAAEFLSPIEVLVSIRKKFDS